MRGSLLAPVQIVWTASVHSQTLLPEVTLVEPFKTGSGKHELNMTVVYGPNLQIKKYWVQITTGSTGDTDLVLP